MAGPYYPFGPLQIRDGTYDRIKAIPEFKNVFKARTKPLVLNEQGQDEDEQLPTAFVFYRGSTGEAMSDGGNTGAPQMLHRMTMIIQIIVAAGNEQVLDIDAHAFTEQVAMTLLTDNTWHDLFEGLERFDVVMLYPDQTELYLVRTEINIEVTYRSIWDPITPHDFRSVGLYRPNDPEKFDNNVQANIEIPLL